MVVLSVRRHSNEVRLSVGCSGPLGLTNAAAEKIGGYYWIYSGVQCALYWGAGHSWQRSALVFVQPDQDK